jgi:hypothetical protein
MTLVYRNSMADRNPPGEAAWSILYEYPNRMGKFETILVGAVIAVAPPLLLLFAAWWSAYGVAVAVSHMTGDALPEKAIAVSALSGLAAGVLLDCLFLRRWTRRVYDLKTPILVAAYLACAIVGFAVCMGVPVFHPLLGIVAGLYAGRKLAHARVEPERAKRAMRQVAAFAALVMLGICILSGTIALVNPTTPRELQRMFRAPFDVSWTMVGGLILAGGAALVLLQYWLARKAAVLACGRPLQRGNNGR